jgi:hypothetical protein
MSETMARQGGLVKMEQFTMLLTFNMAKMDKQSFLHTMIEQTKYHV